MVSTSALHVGFPLKTPPLGVIVRRRSTGFPLMSLFFFGHGLPARVQWGTVETIEVADGDIHASVKPHHFLSHFLRVRRLRRGCIISTGA
jgi:hypothetical protein